MAFKHDILNFLKENPGASPSDISGDLQRSNKMVRVYLSGLKSDGLVDNKEHGRYTLTDKGANLLNKFESSHTSNRRFFTTIPSYIENQNIKKIANSDDERKSRFSEVSEFTSDLEELSEAIIKFRNRNGKKITESMLEALKTKLLK